MSRKASWILRPSELDEKETLDSAAAEPNRQHAARFIGYQMYQQRHLLGHCVNPRSKPATKNAALSGPLASTNERGEAGPKSGYPGNLLVGPALGGESTEIALFPLLLTATPDFDR